MFNSSFCSYPKRGPHGDSRYRGNTSGYIVKDFLSHFHPGHDSLFVDPAEGSGTSRDVASEMEIRYVGLDLKDGLGTGESLLKRVGESAQTIFFHPPYFRAIKYSGHVWGDVAHERDLSNCGSIIEKNLKTIISGGKKLGRLFRFLLISKELTGVYIV